MTLWTQDRREVLRWYHEYKRKQRCEMCGIRGEKVNLTAHHLDPSEKRFNISHMAIRGFSVARIKEELSKCCWLCWKCHRAAHKEDKCV